ncbi:MAG TPA: metallophosphoesterase [Candidatus Bilamarchaeum sp.]|nr:metallophosphoesterase [Candidatus Bilamarchaeum sp.]
MRRLRDMITPDKPVFAVSALLILVFLYSTLIEPYNISVTESRFDIFPGSPAPLKAVLISDTQTAYDYPEYFRRAIAEANAQNPDFVLIAGDIVDGEPRGYLKLGELKNLKSRYGVFAVLGNHDYGDWNCANPANYEYADNVTETLESMGIVVLRNQNSVLEAGGQKLAIAGIDDLWACRSEPQKALANLSQNMPKIILLHQQEAIYGLSPGVNTVAFAGHTHCGQFYFPFITDYLTEYLGFGKARQGRTTLPGGTAAYVTCGLTPGGIRLFARPEISVIYLD